MHRKCTILNIIHCCKYMTVISSYLRSIKSDVSKSWNFKIQQRFTQFAKISISYSENRVQFWKNEICKIQSILQNKENLRKHNISGSKMYVSINSAMSKLIQAVISVCNTFIKVCTQGILFFIILKGKHLLNTQS